MKFPYHLLFCLLGACGVGCSVQKPPAAVAPSPTVADNARVESPKPTPLLLISIDAYRADYFDRGISPTLALLAQQGVHADAMRPAFPSLTFPNHYTLVTGLTPDHHGVIANTMSDSQLGGFTPKTAAANDGRWWSEATPIWETADEQGLRTATMFWPGSGAEIHHHRPDYWKPYDGAVTPDQRVDQILAWLDLPPAQRPSFLTLYFDGVDHGGHDHGPDSPEVNQAIRDTDAALARLLQGLKQRGLYGHINIIVVADHGMASVPLQNSIFIDRLIPLDKVATVDLGVLAGFNPKSNSAASRQTFARIEAKMSRPQRHMQCWDKTKVPARFEYGHNPRVPQLLCLADVGWRITSADEIAHGDKPLKVGEHGYDNADPRMRALFIAAGPAFREGLRVAEFPNVDVYPLIMHLLGLTPLPNDGDFSAVSGMLKSPVP